MRQALFHRKGKIVVCFCGHIQVYRGKRKGKYAFITCAACNTSIRLEELYRSGPEKIMPRQHIDPERRRTSTNFSVERRVIDGIRKTAQAQGVTDSHYVNTVLKKALRLAD